MNGELTLVLTVGMLLMVAGSLSMLGVSLASPSLRGTGWFSAAFGAASLVAGLRLVNNPVFETFLADFAVLTCFLFLHNAVLRLVPQAANPFWPRLLPLLVQIGVDLACQVHWLAPRMRVVSLGFLVAVQGLTICSTARRLAAGALRVPGLFFNLLLLTFVGCNLLRSALLLAAWLSPAHEMFMTLAIFCLYFAVALGLAFGFFWITTAKLTAEIEHTASTDPLTRVYNRRHFLKWCEKELLRSQRSGIPFSVLMVDLDHFKCVNDNFGHGRGDEVLCHAVERMQDSIRGIDVLCRWGGEEFAVLLPNAFPEATGIVAERIRVNILRMAVPLTVGEEPNGAGGCLTASIGASTYSGPEDDIAAMLLRADRALYRAKQTGRNRVLVGT